MPKRIIDAEAAWQSDKLARCRPESIPEYTWLYGLADSFGNFELTNLRAIHSKAYASIRPTVTLPDVERFLADFERHGLLFVWTEGNRKYGHWTGCEKPGRLPPHGQRGRYSGNLKLQDLYEKDGTPIPALVEYLEQTALAHKEDASAQLVLAEAPRPRFQELRDLSKTVNRLAAERVDSLQATAKETSQTPTEQEEFQAVWNHFRGTYPRDHFRRDDYCYRVVKALALPDLRQFKTAYDRHRATWKDDRYVPMSDNFLQKEHWKLSAEVNGNGRPKEYGPAARTIESNRAHAKRVDDFFDNWEKSNS
jgi:hypothetical protein